MKKSIWVLTLILLLCAVCACGKKDEETENDVSKRKTEAAASGLHHAEITIKNYGVIKVELDEKAAPITVANFIRLAESGFYDGSTFHRIIDGFMIQGGALKDGKTVSMIKGEFAANGVENPLKHVVGTISMARAKALDSASSQFFIMVGDAPHLDGNYAAFGHVTEGIEIAMKIAKDAKPTDNNGTIPKDQQPVIEKIVITD